MENNSFNTPGRKRGRPAQKGGYMEMKQQMDQKIVTKTQNFQSDPTINLDGGNQQPLEEQPEGISYEEFQRINALKQDKNLKSDPLTTAVPAPELAAQQERDQLVVNRQKDDEQQSEIMRHEAVLAGKRRFKEIRTQLGMDLQAYPNKSINFLQKLNNLLQANLASQQVSASSTENATNSLNLPYRKTGGSTNDKLWYGGEQPNDEQSLRRIRRRIEKEVFKQESKYHRQQMEVKLKALEAIIDIQSEKIARMQSQFDQALAQMVAVVGGVGNDSDDGEGDVHELQTDKQPNELDISVLK